jgi:putative PIN family toxin of toxin-antitoxin system
VIRTTWDTNTLASGAIARQGAIAELIDRWYRADFEIVVSGHILIELERTLRKPYFMARLSDQEREAFLNLVRRFAVHTIVSAPMPAVLPQRADNVVLATAVSAGASYVITGDRKMRELGEYLGVRILSAREFIDLLNAAAAWE